MTIQNDYDEWAESYDDDVNLTRDLDQTVTRGLLAGSRADSVLELGCGTGKNTAFYAQIGSSVRALDFSAGMVEKARQKVRAGNVRFEMADISLRWPCDEGEFDLIACNLVLEHIEDLGHIFSEAARTLHPGGKFFINELHPFKQYEGKKARFHRQGETVEVEAFIHHLSDFSNAAARNGLKLAGFDEFWHEQDAGKPPRLVSFLFEKG